MDSTLHHPAFPPNPETNMRPTFVGAKRLRGNQSDRLLLQSEVRRQQSLDDKWMRDAWSDEDEPSRKCRVTEDRFEVKSVMGAKGGIMGLLSE